MVMHMDNLKGWSRGSGFGSVLIESILLIFEKQQTRNARTKANNINRIGCPSIITLRTHIFASIENLQLKSDEINVFFFGILLILLIILSRLIVQTNVALCRLITFLNIPFFFAYTNHPYTVLIPLSLCLLIEPHCTWNAGKRVFLCSRMRCVCVYSTDQ